ncbi:hypothetical protein FF38_06734 [Lucilia cuprina]|uniref:Uncharacterized protein n=1 Tax=Lucilia cuprina TaxID=7375 RepID=A0A0L0CU58_LUCCU|nr:hypothetical protein FF38_06734 [Lucilia cuprina]
MFALTPMGPCLRIRKPPQSQVLTLKLSIMLTLNHALVLTLNQSIVLIIDRSMVWTTTDHSILLHINQSITLIIDQYIVLTIDQSIFLTDQTERRRERSHGSLNSLTNGKQKPYYEYEPISKERNQI